MEGQTEGHIKKKTSTYFKKRKEERQKEKGRGTLKSWMISIELRKRD